jgi:hypothetical protein
MVLSLLIGVEQLVDGPSRLHLRGLNGLVNRPKVNWRISIQNNGNASELTFDTDGQMSDLYVPTDDINLGIDIEGSIRLRVRVCHRQRSFVANSPSMMRISCDVTGL